MTDIQLVLTTLAGNTLLLGVLGFLGKAIFKEMLAQDTKAFEARLRADTDSEIERLRSELAHTVESHKARLKKSDFLFQKEFEAASAFTAFFRSFSPKANRPDMDWHEACEVIASEFGNTESRLEAFLTTHGAVLLPEQRESLDKALAILSDGKFAMASYDVSETDCANDLYDILMDLGAEPTGRGWSPSCSCAFSQRPRGLADPGPSARRPRPRMALCGPVAADAHMLRSTGLPTGSPAHLVRLHGPKGT
ncbi:hypothetical protein [Brevundimonas sp.]|uniref:hypothetical protein n=1 Tax=Brevundimonas sp. TaxID=1871086 RepID=UPI00289856D9|nr:hypothetical protein [Brevundimonas sp.]